MYLTLTEEQKVIINEISALSGIQKNVVREVWEFTLVRWAELIAKAGPARASLEIPFLGNLSVKYEGDKVEPDGTVTTEVSSFLALNPLFKKLIGDINDEKDSVVLGLLNKKIENATLTMTAKDH